jgi:hypothetical protein
MQNKLQYIRTARRAGDQTGISLSKRRVWYADNPASTETPPPSASPAGALNTEKPDEGKSETHVSYKRFSEVVSERKALEEQLAQFQRAESDRKAAEEAQQRKQAEEQGQFKKLFEDTDKRVKELEPLAAEAKALREAFQKTLDKRMESVPDHIKSLLGKMSPLEAMAWLDENTDKLTPQRQAPPTDAGSKGDRRNGTYVGSEKHIEEVMKRYGLNNR